MDELRIDSHKLMYHPERVAEWLRGETVYPIYMEISPTGRCNLRCVFCAFDYVDYPNRHLDTARMKDLLAELGALGVKSIMYAGEGEPFLHPDMPELLVRTKECGIDTAVATNAVLLTPEVSEQCLPSLSWVRVSINAGTPEGYRTVHGAAEKTFEKVLGNLAAAVRIKKGRGLDCRIGAQIVLVKENMGEVGPLAARLAEIGLDYLTVKPYIPHPLCLHGRVENYGPGELDDIQNELDKIDARGLNIVFRRHGFEKLAGEERRYSACHGVNFFAEIASDGNVYTCGPFLGIAEHRYGNIYENTFREVWEGEARKRVLERIASLDLGACMPNCRLDEINYYLWQLRDRRPEHVNFI